MDDKKWMDEYKETNPSELAETANDLLATVDDPKLTNSEVGKWQNIISAVVINNNVEYFY